MGNAKPYASREEEEEARIGGALRNLERWGAQAGAAGITGHVRVQAQAGDSSGRSLVSSAHTVAIGNSEPAGMTKLPRGTSLEGASAFFAERDRLKQTAPEITPAEITASAISNVQTGNLTPVRVLKYRLMRWLYLAITKELK